MTENPYSPPQSDLTTGGPMDETAELAGRGQRLGAAILDTLLSLVILMPLMVYSGYLKRSANG
jgi:hypothetical protein